MNALVNQVDGCLVFPQTLRATCGAYTAVRFQGIDTGETLYFETSTGKLEAVLGDWASGMGGEDCEAGLATGFWKPECPAFTANPQNCAPRGP